MKHFNLVTAVLTLSLFGAGCSKSLTAKNESSTDLVGGLIVADPSTVGETASGTNTVPLITSYADMNSYVAIRALNNPTDIKVTVDLTKDSRARYTGAIVISYMDNGTRYQGVFQAGNSKNSSIKYAAGNDQYENEYNFWWSDSGYTVFTGNFQDKYGGLVLVIDNVSTIGNNDGVGQTVLSGSIWYRNFSTVYAPQSPYRKCWFITDGPYDCRSNSIIQKSSIYPSDTYRKLGTFSGLSKSQAFKN